jgi:Fe-S cluster biogenesis protein NfuA
VTSAANKSSRGSIEAASWKAGHKPLHLAATNLPVHGGVLLQRRNVFVTTTNTPNPDSMMFHPEDCHVMGTGTKTKIFSNKYDTNDSPLAAALFKVKGVKEIMLAAEHVTVTKVAAIDWMLVEPNIQLVMSQFFAAGLQAIKESAIEREERPRQQIDAEPGSLEAQILDILEERVRPFVQQDGGDVSFDRFDTADGTLYLAMHGACSGCPKSNVTLQIGIKNLMQHFIPEVKDVLPVEEEEEEEDIPRPREMAI